MVDVSGTSSQSLFIQSLAHRLFLVQVCCALNQQYIIYFYPEIADMKIGAVVVVVGPQSNEPNIVQWQ